MEISKPRLKEVLEYLKNEKNLSQNRIVEIFNEKDSTLCLTPQRLSNFKTGTQKFIEKKLCLLFWENFNINPAFLYGDSTDMIDHVKVEFEYFKTLINKWDTVEKIFRDTDGTTFTKKYLHLTLRKSFYDFLLEIHSAEDFKNSSMAQYDIAFNEAKHKYNKSDLNLLNEYVLIPRDEWIKILQNEKRNLDILDKIVNLDTIINYPNHFCYLEE